MNRPALPWLSRIALTGRWRPSIVGGVPLAPTEAPEPTPPVRGALREPVSVQCPGCEESYERPAEFLVHLSRCPVRAAA